MSFPAVYGAVNLVYLFVLIDDQKICWCSLSRFPKTPHSLTNIIAILMLNRMHVRSSKERLLNYQRIFNGINIHIPHSLQSFCHKLSYEIHLLKICHFHSLFQDTKYHRFVILNLLLQISDIVHTAQKTKRILKIKTKISSQTFHQMQRQSRRIKFGKTLFRQITSRWFSRNFVPLREISDDHKE